MSRPRRSPALAVLGAVLAIGLAEGGCSQTTRVTRVTAVAPPLVADSPTAVVDVLRWTCNHRSMDVYRTLWTDDLQFGFAVTDPAGIAFAQDPWTREDELIYAQRLFVGGSTEAPASSITLDFLSAPQGLPDPRPGKSSIHHRVVPVRVHLKVSRRSDVFDVDGEANFFVVRGDSAHIPSDLGLGPDSTRWYLDRWDDLTGGGGSSLRTRAGVPLGAQPGTRPSWGAIKVLYRLAPVAPPTVVAHAVGERR